VDFAGKGIGFLQNDFIVCFRIEIAENHSKSFQSKIKDKIKKKVKKIKNILNTHPNASAVCSMDLAE
jgi:hypothetical protein